MRKQKLNFLRLMLVSCTTAGLFSFILKHVNVWCTNISAKRKITMFLQSCSRPQAVRAHEKKRTSNRPAHKKSSGYSAGRKASKRHPARKDTRIIRYVMFFLCVMMRNGYTIETNEIMNGLKRTKNFIQQFAIEDWKRKKKKLRCKRIKIFEQQVFYPRVVALWISLSKKSYESQNINDSKNNQANL